MRLREEKQLQEAFSKKERAERLLSNLERVREEGEITDEQYEGMKSKYIHTINEASAEVEQIKSKLAKDIEKEEESLKIYEQELKNLEAKFKVGEISADEYQKSVRRTKDKIEKIQAKIEELKRLKDAKSSADVGGYVEVKETAKKSASRGGGGRGVDFGEAFRYPLQNLGNILVGGVLYILGIFIIPAFLVYGYIIQVMSDTIEGKDEMPKWENWGDLLVKGICSFIIVLIYLIAPIIIIIATIGASLIPGLMTGSLGAALAGASIGIAVSIILAFFFGFACLIGLLRYAEEGRIGSAFAFSEIINEMREKFAQYILAYIIIFCVSLVLFFFMTLTIVGILLAAFVEFYIAVVGARMFAEIHRG